MRRISVSATAGFLFALWSFLGPAIAANPQKATHSVVSLISSKKFPARSEAAILADRMMLSVQLDAKVDGEQRAVLIKEIETVLKAFREQEPEMAHIRVRGENQGASLIVKLSPELFVSVANHFKDDKTTAILRTGNEKFDSLNRKLGLKYLHLAGYMDTIVGYYENLGDARLASARYSHIDGVIYAEPNSVIGDGPDLNLLKSDNGVWHIVARNAWGDCPAGCIYSELRYYTLSNGTVTEVKSKSANKSRDFIKASKQWGLPKPPGSFRREPTPE